MCPLASTKIVVENDSTTFSKDLIDHVRYVAPKDMKPTDVEVEPVSNDQLAELAAAYPKEYGEKAKAAGVDVNQGTGRLARLLEMNAKELSRQISEMAQETDEEVLWALHEAELEREEPRKTVLEALAVKGIKE